MADFFKTKENEQLKRRIAELEAMLTPEVHNHLHLQEQIRLQQQRLYELQSQYAQMQIGQQQSIAKYQSALAQIQQQIQMARTELVETNETVLLQSFGIYRPHYAFANSTGYKEALARIRNQQKEMVKNGQAATGAAGWSVNGDRRQGEKMIHDMQKLLIRAFNSECDDVISNVKFSNIESAEKRIQTAFSTISRLGSVCGVAITGAYRDLKFQELHLAHEYQIEKQKEKDRLRQLRAEERERAKLEKEIEEARKKIEKEKKHYANALTKINQQISSASPDTLADLEAKRVDLEEKLGDLGKSMEQIDYRLANQKAGYVYIISNVGAFGEGVYKIGMTRRLEPMDRIDELGDASVPFDFDVHALIFSEDAPALEAKLHQAFENRKLNMVNTRREFFRVSLDEIKQVVCQNFDKTVEFVDVPPAEQYRQSELMRKN